MWTRIDVQVAGRGTASGTTPRVCSLRFREHGRAGRGFTAAKATRPRPSKGGVEVGVLAEVPVQRLQRGRRLLSHGRQDGRTHDLEVVVDHVDHFLVAQGPHDRLHVGVGDPAHLVVRPGHLGRAALGQGPDVAVRREGAGADVASTTRTPTRRSSGTSVATTASMPP